MDDSSASEDPLAALGRPYAALRERFGSRHAELLASIDAKNPARLVADPCGDARWTVSVAAIDAPGVLAIIAGLFAGNHVDIRNGDVFTLRPPADPPPPPRPPSRRGGMHRPPPRVGKKKSGKILDIFEVMTSAWADEDFWSDLERELAELVALLGQGETDAAVERVTLRVSESVDSVSELEEPLYPMSVSVENPEMLSATELRLHASDTPAFLFEFANALTLLDVNIDRVKIRTLYGAARDSFWVTDSRGKKIEDDGKIQELRVATALIKQFSHLLPSSANPGQALQQFTKFTADVLRRPDWTATLEPLGSGDVLRTLADMMGVSSFLWEDFLRLQHENLFPVLSDVPGLELSKDRSELEKEFEAEIEDADVEEATRTLNRAKDREMFRIDLRHVTRRIGMEAFAVELTALAETTIQKAADISWKAVEERFGRFERPWSICGAGKLGGRELGYASDIEIVFVCDLVDDGDPEAKTHFESFAQTLIKTLAARQDGVFEVDLRLRPFGDAGPLTSTLATWRSYYRTGGQAQQFERMSLVKLRPIAGDPELGREIEAMRDAFTYSEEPIDRDNIRHLRKRQVEETVGSGATNAKFSPGGLVDIEYFFQARQIELGANHPELRTSSTHDAITRLANLGELEDGLAARVTDSYRFLRRLIDALRCVRGNAKDVNIPALTAREFAYLSRRLEYASPESLQRDVERHMAVARDLWL